MGIFPLLPLPLCKPSHPATSLLFMPSLFLFTLPLCLFFLTPPHTHTHQSTLSLLPGRFVHGMGFSCEDVLDEEPSGGIHLTDDTIATQPGSVALMQVHRHHHHQQQQQQVVENEADFWPVEHPLEPRDEDRPVKCPMPQSSVINDGRMHEKKFAESIRKRAEASAEMAERGGERRAGMDAEPPDPARAVRKRHHTLTHGGDLEITPFIRAPPLPPLPSQNVTIFQMLQQVDKFDS